MQPPAWQGGSGRGHGTGRAGITLRPESNHLAVQRLRLLFLLSNQDSTQMFRRHIQLCLYPPPFALIEGLLLLLLSS